MYPLMDSNIDWLFSAVLTLVIKPSLWNAESTSLRYVLISKIAESYAFFFSFIRKLHILLYNYCTPFHSHKFSILHIYGIYLYLIISLFIIFIFNRNEMIGHNGFDIYLLSIFRHMCSVFISSFKILLLFLWGDEVLYERTC